jgi:acylphosphatase
MRRLTAIISGSVQRGVRIRIWKEALLIRLNGYVKNLPDGRVQVVAESEVVDLERFASTLAIKERWASVSTIDKCYSLATGEFKSFDILWDERDAELYEIAEVLIEAFDRQAQNLD